MLKNSSKGIGHQLPQQPSHNQNSLNHFTSTFVQSQTYPPEASLGTELLQAPSAMLDTLVNITEVKDDSIEIFAKTTEIRRREFSRHKKLDQRNIKS